MRNWQLTASDPMTLGLAADARLFETDYADDQIWRLVLGEADAPALALETRYGGRCGLARLVPMWVVNDRVIYEASAYASPPTLLSFWPSYLRLSARPIRDLPVQVEYWAMTSHVIGGRITFRNESDTHIEAGLDMIGQVMTEQQPGDLNLLTLDSGQYALQMKNVGSLQPVMMMHAVVQASGDRPKLAARVMVPTGEQTVIRWVQAAYPSVKQSLAHAHHWLYKEDWNTYLKRLRDINTATPIIETGDRDRDAAIAFSYKVALSSLVGPTDELPHASLVTTRIPSRGFSPRGDGADHYRQWRGQAAPDVYLALGALASAAPEQAKGLIRNYAAVAESDGFIDRQPGLAGQRAGELSPPLLATMAWEVYGFTQDAAFLKEVFPGLLRFFERWFQPDVDQDGDGLPEWASPQQCGFDNHPTFVPYRRWSQNIDISKAETPDLAAYLIREARSLQAIADVVKQQKTGKRLQKRIDALQAGLQALWQADAGTFRYRDRDAHVSGTGQMIAEGPGDQMLIPSLGLAEPNRLVVRVMGGVNHQPDVTVTLEGIGADGQPLTETLLREAFAWYRSMGAASSQHVYTRIDRITTQGLSRVYTVQVSSVDWTQPDQTLLLPLWAGLDDPAQVERLIAAISSPEQYWRRHGMPVVPADLALYEIEGSDSIGGINLFWNTLLGEGLIEAGRADLAAELLTRIMKVQIGSLHATKRFHESYHPDEPRGIGDADHVAGIVPLTLLWNLLGFRIVSDRRVLIGGVYALPWAVRVQHHGVTIERSSKGAKITFPSGHVKRIRSDKWRIIDDETVPARKSAPPPVKPASPPPGPKPVRKAGKTVRVDVQRTPPDNTDPFA
jgi:hypothetical protein